jgi:hypothetical protein
MPIKELKRTRYLDQAGSTFHQTNDHLEDLDHYHVPVIRMHNANLHRWGVAGGLEVEKKSPSELEIREGLAIDVYGRSIPLASIGQQSGQPGKAFIDDNTSPAPPDQSKLRDVPVTLPTTNFANGLYYVTIELVTTQVLNPYTGQPESVEGRLVNESINSRIVSTPLIKLNPTASFINDGTSIILATVNITGGQVTSLSGDNRQIARIAVGEVIFKHGGQIGAGPEVGDKEGASIKPIATGGLKVEVSNPGDSVLFAEKSGGNFTKMSVAANQIVARRSDGKESVVIDTQAGNITAGTTGVEGDILVKDASNRLVITLDGNSAAIVVGAAGNEGDISVKDNGGAESAKIDGNTGTLFIKRIDPYGNVLDIDARYVRIHGWDLCLDGRSGGNKRALVDYTNKLIINFANDYANGVETPGNFKVGGTLRTTVSGIDRILGGNPARYVTYRFLFADNGTDTEEVNLGSARNFTAFVSIIGMDPRHDFDRGDAFAVDVNMTPWYFRDGDHFGPANSSTNIRAPFYTGNGQRIIFRARSFQDASVLAIGVVFYE